MRIEYLIVTFILIIIVVGAVILMLSGVIPGFQEILNIFK